MRLLPCKTNLTSSQENDDRAGEPGDKAIALYIKKGSFDPYLVTAVSYIIGQFQKNYPAMTFLRLWNVYVVY